MTRIEELETQISVLQAERNGAVAREAVSADNIAMWRARAIEAENLLRIQRKTVRMMRKLIRAFDE